jgi:hypothetical protein
LTVIEFTLQEIAVGEEQGKCTGCRRAAKQRFGRCLMIRRQGSAKTKTKKRLVSAGGWYVHDPWIHTGIVSYPTTPENLSQSR